MSNAPPEKDELVVVFCPDCGSMELVVGEDQRLAFDYDTVMWLAEQIAHHKRIIGPKGPKGHQKPHVH
jgi:hypothetical protein